MRVNSFIAMLAAVWFGYLTLTLPPSETALYLTFAFLGAAFAPKTVQKMIEQQTPPKPSSPNQQDPT